MTRLRSLDNRALAETVRNHGGILGAIEFGISSHEVSDPELATAWRQLERLYAEIRPNLAVISRVLAKSGAR